jgi:hypothetical protein
MKKPKQMPKAQRDRLKVGDWIKVRTWNREGYITVTRKIVYRGESGIGIRLFGYNPFYLYSKHDIIIEKVKR